MQKLIISLICCLLPAIALAETPALRDDAPEQYVVVKGDTLWDISAKFFKDPWKWPEIWGLNQDAVRNPHWIYPGDIIVLDHLAGTLRVGGAVPAAPAESAVPATTEAAAVPTAPEAEAQVAPGAVATILPGNVTKLTPKVRALAGTREAIPSIPLADIEPFLKRPLVIEEKELDTAPTIIGTFEGRVILGTDDIAYVRNLPDKRGTTWQLYRPGKELIDPETEEVLGHEAIYLGEARVEKFDKISTLRITNSVLEIHVGDRLVQAFGSVPSNFIPRAPATKISARVAATYNGVSMTGQHSVVAINKGARDGLENGHVLALYHKGGITQYEDKAYRLPDTRFGLLFVFRTFENVAYGLVMQSRLPVEVMDIAETP